MAEPLAEAAAEDDARDAVAVVERTEEPLAGDNPLARELKAAMAETAASGSAIPRVVGASAGRHFPHAPVSAASPNSSRPTACRNRFSTSTSISRVCSRRSPR